MTTTGGESTRIDARTWVPIGLLAGILSAAVWGTATAVGGFKDITAAQTSIAESSARTSLAVERQGSVIQQLSDDLYRIRVDLNTVLDDPWHMRDMRFWVLSTQQAFDRAGIHVQLAPVESIETATAVDKDRK